MNSFRLPIEKYGFIEDEDFFKHEDLSSPNLASSKARRQKIIPCLGVA